MTALQGITLALRALMELSIVLGLGYWGFTAGDGTAAQLLLGLGAPIVGFGFWGLVDFHQAGRWAEPLRLIQELAVTGLVALALVAAGQPILGLALAILTVGYHALVYAQGARLLKA